MKIVDLKDNNIKEKIINCIRFVVGANLLANLSYRISSSFLKVVIIFIGFILMRTDLEVKDDGKIKVYQYIYEKTDWIPNLIKDAVGIYCLVVLANSVDSTILELISMFTGVALLLR